MFDGWRCCLVKVTTVALCVFNCSIVFTFLVMLSMDLSAWAMEEEPVGRFVKIEAMASVKKRPVQLIIDTDAGFDVDDVGAITVAHKMMDMGECEIVAVVSEPRFVFERWKKLNWTILATSLVCRQFKLKQSSSSKPQRCPSFCCF